MIEELEELTTQPIPASLTVFDRGKINATLLHWFEATNKRQVPDLDLRVKAFKVRLSRLASVIEISYYRGRLTSSAPGDSADTLAQVRGGSLWFDGWNNLEARLLAVLND